MTPLKTTLKAAHEAPYPGSGRAQPANVVALGSARFTVLGPGLLRLEHQAQSRFEDRASYFAVRRDQAAQAFTATEEAGQLRIETERLSLAYKPDGKPFSPANLRIEVKPIQGHPGALWRPGDVNAGNLGGTLRTLDECEGPLDLEPGVLSRDGWFLRDDSGTVLFTDDEPAWATARPEDAGSDWYFFAYGLDYGSALRDLASVSGPIPLPPKYGLGAWYSRYWPYTAEEFVAIADEFRQRGYPLDVMVLDMDWHQAGWTGYSWNRGLIPDPDALLRELRERGLRTTMNLHPHDGVAAHEDAYPAFAAALGLDPAKGATVPFDVTDPGFMRRYFELLLRPLERQGVDFWWMDWQQGTESRIRGLDPLMWLNHLHFWDRQREREGALRGMNFSRWGGWGDHRYPVHFSGDTHANWEVLGYLAKFTASAGNVGVAYWSHDLGGHFGSGNHVEPELYLRWLQFGALSPVMRIHSSRDPRNDRRPWLFGEQFAQAAKGAFALRSALVPYLYTAARQAFDKALPLLRPLYLHYPDSEDAYRCPDQYLLGEDLLAVTVADPGFGPRKAVHAPVWFPEGDWYHWQTHQRFQGPQWTCVPVPLDGVALFARGGAAIPLNAPGHAQACSSNGPQVLRVYPGPATQRDLYEDDGEGLDYARGGGRWTRLRTEALGLGTRLSVGPRSDGGPRPELVVEAPRHFEAHAPGRSAETKTLGPSRATVPAGTAPASVELTYLADGLLADIYDGALELQQRALLGLDQLGQSHALRSDLHKLASEAEQLLNLFHGRESLASIQGAFQALQALEQAAIRSLAQAEGSEAALRVLAGVSLLAHVDRGEDGKPLLRAELRRDARAVAQSQGSVSFRWSVDGGPQQEGRLSLDGACRLAWQGAWTVPDSDLRVTQGRLRATLQVFGLTVELSEAVEWDGRSVKDWAVLGPVDAALDVRADSVAVWAESESARAADWSAHRFDPSRVAKGLRHFHDLGERFHCPGQAVWALAELLATADGEVSLQLRHEGKARLWMNGKEISLGDQPSFKAWLKAGANAVLIQLKDVKTHGRGIHLSVGSVDGRLASRPARALTAALKQQRS